MRNGKFGDHKGYMRIISMTDCGDYPGLLISRIKLVSEIIENIGHKMDFIHLGTCVKTVIETAKCPIDFDEVKKHIDNKIGIKTVF